MCVCVWCVYQCLCDCAVTLTAQHVIVRIVCDGVDVRRRLRAAFAFVGGDHRGCVDGQPFVWIHRHTEEPGVRLRKENMTQR